jgi:hypothetical protein
MAKCMGGGVQKFLLIRKYPGTPAGGMNFTCKKIYRFSPYRAVNTLRLSYKNVSVIVVYISNRELFSET